MVFPVLMFPACILHALSDLLIPELARCAASGNSPRIQYLASRCLGAALVYGFIFSGGMFLISEELCVLLYNNSTAGAILKQYSLLIPMLYCDSLVDAMTKGLGQQKTCVRYNIITSALDVAGLYFLLPKLGMTGYFISFLVTHMINFLLSLRRLLLITKITISHRKTVLCIISALICINISSVAPGSFVKVLSYPLLYCSLLSVLGVVNKQDIPWLKGFFSVNAKTAS